jgi:hypothetical protein
MSRFSITIETLDGLCPASLLTPTGQAGPWPAMIFFMDGFGIRPAMWEMVNAWRIEAMWSCCRTSTTASGPIRR